MDSKNSPFSRQLSSIASIYASRSMVVRMPQAGGGWKAAIMNLVRLILRIKE
jgi:hypothetical protein